MGYLLYITRLYTCVLRRRSALLKVIFLICTVWLTVAFLLFAEQRNRNNGSNNSNLDNLGLQNEDSSGNNLNKMPQAAPFIDSDNQQRRKKDAADLSNDNNSVDGGDKINNDGNPVGEGDGVLVAPKNVNEAPVFGEMGKPVVLPTTNISPEVKKLIDEGWQKNAFNQYVSDLISLHRKLPDPRDEW